jgi:lipoprotein-anchoring transpeptidase ErfK/SrfK
LAKHGLINTRIIVIKIVLKAIFSKTHLLVAVWIVGSTILVSNLAFSAYYQDKIYPGVKVGTVSVGGLTRLQAQDKLNDRLSDYRLMVRVDNKSYLVAPKQFGAEYETGMTISNAFQRGRDALLPIWGALQAARQNDLTLAYSIDNSALKEYAHKLSSQQALAPVDASVSIVNGAPVVTPAKNGLGIDKAKLTALIFEGIDTQADRISITRTPLPAEVSTQAAEQAANQAKQIAATKITLTYQDKKFTPTAAQIAAWLSFTKEGSAIVTAVDAAKVKDYVKTLSASINIAAVSKQVNVVNGEVKSEELGKDGLAVSEDQLVSSLSSAAKTGGAAQITIPTATVAHKTIYNRTIELADGRYIEVNLSLQHMWAYQDHKLIFDSPVTSGAAGAGFPTVQGLFSIYNKQQNRYLNGYALGYNYNVFVKYWMPFHRDFGLHDASWRSTFGGPDYYYNGSHGCVNLPETTAAWMYGWADIGTPVWVHG